VTPPSRLCYRTCGWQGFVVTTGRWVSFFAPPVKKLPPTFILLPTPGDAAIRYSFPSLFTVRSPFSDLF